MTKTKTWRKLFWKLLKFFACELFTFKIFGSLQLPNTPKTLPQLCCWVTDYDQYKKSIDIFNFQLLMNEIAEQWNKTKHKNSLHVEDYWEILINEHFELWTLHWTLINEKMKKNSRITRFTGKEIFSDKFSRENSKPQSAGSCWVKLKNT